MKIRDEARAYIRMSRGGALSEKHLTMILAGVYRSGLSRGYGLAVHDFFNATRRGEVDEDWDTNQPSLKRVLAALKRWYP